MIIKSLRVFEKQSPVTRGDTGTARGVALQRILATICIFKEKSNATI